MKQFVIIFDRPKGDILEMVEFAESDQDAALEELFAREVQYRERGDIEVVMLGSDSVETLKLTHARYFKGELQKRIATLG